MRVIFTLGALVCVAVASSGDGSREFQDCVSTCDVHTCPDAVLPLSLQATAWTCTDDCKYNCMHLITDRDVSIGVPMQQYYGKWPFWRLLGMQEPASVAFSLMNLMAHVQGFRMVTKQMPEGHPMTGYYLTSTIISCAAWTLSAVFHTRDLPMTEKLDYFCAALTILFGLYSAAIRIFHLYPPPPSRFGFARSWQAERWESRIHVVNRLWSVACIAVYVGHITYLSSLTRFDYTYNIIFNVILGLFHNLLWVAYALPVWLFPMPRFPSGDPSYHPPFALQPALLVALTSGAMAFELFDFPPWWRVIDAHSLWHLSTAPLALMWYDFILRDVKDEHWKEVRAD